MKEDNPANRTFRDQYGEVHVRAPIDYEELDPTPVALPARLKRASNLNEVVRQMVRSEELRRAVEASGAETFDEADDFDIGEDYEPDSPYEEVFNGDVLMDNFARQQLVEAASKQSGQELPPKPPEAPQAPAKSE